MGRSSLQYRSLFQHFLPRGMAWTRNPDAIISQLLYGFGEEFARFEIRIEDLLRESNPIITDELLTDFETDFGIPEPFRSLAVTEEGRRKDLLAKILSVGRQHAQYYIDVAAAMGYTIGLEFYLPASIGVGVFSSGDSCGPSENIFYWKVQIDVNGNKGSFSLDYEPNAFVTLPSNSYDYILSMKRTYPNLWYEINKVKPAHTLALFDWWQRAFDRSFGWSFECFPSYDGSVISCGFSESFSSDFGNNKDYDGDYLVGGFDINFWLDFDAHIGNEFERRAFDYAFSRPM